MSDPAVQAASRAWLDRYDDRTVNVEESAHYNGVGALAIKAAREALAPLREWHTPKPGQYCERVCTGCGYEWPCADARLIYSEEEL
ncbi:hypothetical protein [Gordonia alkanivorans]|uniref:hypothetical protein n=1 Tax=Gordonia alkanivorans TaxID=84096 RepID=UPI0024B75A63|nr:hypothetical protein [Gordonia alkanivorans]MDJ0006496.1 hypothetical protein [Gordonia alkanivorans]MDJ0492124.1 hypothetical protein [Gordonia alkanivorans]